MLPYPNATSRRPVDDGGHPRANANLVRVHPEIAGDVLVDVGVRIDHAGDHELIPRVDGASGGARDPGRHLRNLSAFHGDVTDTIDAGGGIDHAAAPHNQVELRHCISWPLNLSPGNQAA